MIMMIKLTLEENCVDQHESSRWIQGRNNLRHFIMGFVLDILINEADTPFCVTKGDSFDVGIEKRLHLVFKCFLHFKLRVHKEGHALIQLQRSILCDVLVKELKEFWEKFWLLSSLQLMQVESLQYFLARDAVGSH